MPNLINNIHFKNQTKSESEKLFPKRYVKQEINFKEYVALHNSNKRNFPTGKKIVDNIKQIRKTFNFKEKSKVLLF